MTQLKRLTAFLLCLLMMLPTQGLTALADTVPLEYEQVDEALPEEPPEENEELVEGNHPLEAGEGESNYYGDATPSDASNDGEYIIYWNPGGHLPDELATASDAVATTSDATPSNAAAGKDNADGLSVATPVKTLAKAIERAEKLMEEEGLLSSDITIYAMNPMEIPDGELYVLNGGNVCIASWPGRSYESDAVFYINGGQLTLVNTIIRSGKVNHDIQETELIYVSGGILQTGQNVTVEGRVILDYRGELEVAAWATSSDALVMEEEEPPLQSLANMKQKQTVGEATFDISNYILTADEDVVELLEDTKEVSTWQEPMIELIEGFNGAGEYLLEVRDDSDEDARELVKTLYADEATAEEFLSHFTLAEAEFWELEVETQAAAQVRDTGLADEITALSFTFEEGALTRKTLIASRAGVELDVIYWNPGGKVTVGGITYNEGDDDLFDGTAPNAPLKTWRAAAEEARKKDGIVIAMQQLDLGKADAEDYLERLPTGEFYISSIQSTLISTLGSWVSSSQPAIIVPENETLIVENLYLGGMYDHNGNASENITVLVNQGDLIIDKNVKTQEEGYIEVDGFLDLASHPVQVRTTDSTFDGNLKIFFGDINTNIAYRYVDVVVPGGDLAESITNDADPEGKADLVGQALLNRVELHINNRTRENGGLSSIDWSLRQDNGEGDGIKRMQNIELFTIYYYDGIYIDGVNGKDFNYGASCDYPVKTWARARAIWQDEMAKSLKARREATGMNTEEIEAAFPMPEFIYICDTVTIDSASEPEWVLTEYFDDVRNKNIRTEVVSHSDNVLSSGEGGEAVTRHEIPKTLIKVTGNGVLSIRDVFIRNIVDDTDSITIDVEAGGTLNLREKTTLSGTSVTRTGTVVKELTLGKHISVTGGGSLVMETNWKGSIENREQGVVAAGSATKVEMYSGFIRNNNSYRLDLYSAGLTNHKRGGGVALSDGAIFTMNGGEITGNQTYQYGAGVYLTGTGTSFVMNKGKVTENKILTYRVSNNNSSYLYSQGAGIMADTGTIVTIGDGTGGQGDALVSGNQTWLGNGAGIYAAGSLTIDNATISDNIGGGINITYMVNSGVGIYVGTNGTLTMKNSLVSGNHGSTDIAAYIKGAGIYIDAGNKTHTITGSTISNNKSGREYWSSSSGSGYAQGGGIYIAAGNTLNVTGSTIANNKAMRGGGIYMIGSSSAYTNVTFTNSTIKANEAGAHLDLNYGDGGGVYFNGYGNLNFEDGTKLIDNFATEHSAGLFFDGSSLGASHVYMMGTTPNAIEVSGNHITGTLTSYGAGITHRTGSMHLQNVLISNNKGATRGGGISADSSNAYAYMRDVVFSGNEALNGAGLGLNSGRYYLQDITFKDNTATGIGGGIYLGTTSSYLYLSESDEGRFVLQDNHAAYGGGIAVTGTYAFMMDIAGPIQNSADEQGSNFYFSGVGNIDILNGYFKQPELSKQEEGVYNIYIDDTSTSTYTKYFDFSKVTADKKTGADPDVIFLNSGNSSLTVLAAPPDHTAYGSFPIDLNKDVFKSGSIVLKPLGYTYTISRGLMEPDATLNLATTVNRRYESLMDATTNLDHFRDGDVPRRNELAAYRDALNKNKTNVILMGQGVYLAGYKADGTGGNDSNGGTSPDDAVATYEIALEKLEERIRQKAAAESALPEDEREGFAPFIYICGEVVISADEHWELNYEDPLFTDINENYAKEEIRYDEPVYEPQIRRFAAFIEAPMITVGDGSNNINFSTGRLIIDGMADAVILNDQSSRSPVINGRNGTHITLGGDSMIRNNYYYALQIAGELTLQGEEGKVNKQLYNNHAYYTVTLGASAKMSMLDGARIITDDKATRIGAGISSYGVYFAGTGGSLLMDDDSAIVQEAGSSLLSAYFISSNYADTTVELKDKAKLVFGGTSTGGILVNGNGSTITMSENTSIETLPGGSYTYGIYVGANTSLTMSDQSNITYGGNRRSTTYGIAASPGSTTTASVLLKDEAAIVVTDTFTSSSNSYFYGISVNGGIGTEVELQNNARITGPTASFAYMNGINATSSSAKDAIIRLNMETALTEDEKSQSVAITNMVNGISIGAVNGISISSGKNARIADSTYGIYFNGMSSTTPISDILMKDHSTISNNNSGVYFDGIIRSPINFVMEDFAAIEQNTMGISETESYSNSSLGVWQLSIDMYDDSRISGNSRSGIQLVNIYGNMSDTTGYQHITLNDRAVIGGSSYYSSTDAASGNGGSGIYTNGPTQIVMNDSSKISGNGTYINNSTYYFASSCGISFTRYGSTSYHRAGTARLTLNDSASICDNKGGGVYAASIGSATTTYHNAVVIELNGIADDGSLTAPSIQGNTDGIFLGIDATLKVKGGAQIQISDSPYSTSNYAARVIDNYGYVEIDGRSSIDGLIYMNNSEKPVTMTHAGTGSTPKYDLHLVEGFAGKTVVKPDMVGISDLTGATSQRAYFNKASADGMAATRPIVEMSPNLVLLGENAVYLSGSGNDLMTGNTPSTAVRTFARARELLEGDGYYTSGANIIICTSEVRVLAGDSDWSFGPGGTVKNSKSNDEWKPLVIRDENFKGIMINVYSTSSSYASSVTFKNITVDGGSEAGITLTTGENDQLLMINQGCKAYLLDGAVFQNNKAVTSSYRDYSTLGIRIYGGTLEIDGGTIQNIVREITSSFSNYWLSSTISIHSVNATYPSKLIMKSGQIINNELNASLASGTSARLGTIYLTGNNSYMEMSGGLIENNKVTSRDTSPASAGAIVNQNGNVTISGGIIRQNEGGYGSAIYHNSSSKTLSRLIISGGQITNNTTNASGQQSIAQYAPIYIAQYGFELAGGGADINDGIYLYNTLGAIKVTDHILQNRTYRVYLRQGNSTNDFKKGSVVVEPGGGKVTSVTGYLPFFDIRSNPYVLDRGRSSNLAGNVDGVKENQCLILMKAVFLDSVNGKPNNSGLTPALAVKTLEQAKKAGMNTTHGASDHYIVYVSGKAENELNEHSWTLPDNAYMCRYTGFTIYDSNGKESTDVNRAYHGPLIVPVSDLTFKNITIQGRRSIDGNDNNGDSLVNIPAGVHVTVEDGAVFSDNYNMGNYIAEDGKPDNLSSMGGAFQVADGAVLTITGGEIISNSATYGSAIYLHASKTDETSFGELHLTAAPSISGKVYLDGTANTTAAYVQTDAQYVPLTALQISVGNDFNGRPLIRYKDGTVPGEDEIGHFAFDSAVQALYDIVNRSTDKSVLELNLRRVIYLDGKNGSDLSPNDGSSPEKAFRTLKRTFQEIGNKAGTNGVLVYVVNTIDISSTSYEPSNIELMNIQIYEADGTSYYKGYYEDSGGTVDIRGQVYFKRYSQPKDYDEHNPVYDEYGYETLEDSLFHVGNGGTLTLSGIYVDGHAISSDSINPTLVAPAVVAQSPLVTVEGTGVLQCFRADGVSNGVPTATLFINNTNGNHKDAPEYVIGQLNSSDIMEGSGAGIELLDGGTAVLQYTEFSNLALGDNVISGGTDVYSNGFLHFSYNTNFSGSVFLEGLGTKDANHDTSRYITVDVYGTPVRNKFQVFMRDPYMGRDVVHYKSGVTASAEDAAFYLLEERVKDFFCLDNRSGYPHILELQVPVAVYVDGIKGVDDQGNRVAGSTPASPVKSLHRAYELLKTRGGNTIYVVGAIQVSGTVQVTGSSYIGSEGTVNLGSTDKVNIIRYMQPKFAIDDPTEAELTEYDVADYTGVLMNVKDGATVQFSANVNFDGHSEPKTSTDLPIGAIVDRNGEAKAPMITVERGGTLNLLSDVSLYDNNNTYDQNVDPDGQHGGAIYNSGTITVDGALFENNKAARGAVAYQNGTFTIASAPKNLDGHRNTFYLTTVNTGTDADPVWGIDHVIQTAVAIPENQVFEVDMDHAVKGRDVVQFTNSSAYSPNADAEHVHFKLGSTVPENLFLVEAETAPDVLELQNWEILKVEVPNDIYLVVRRRGSMESTTKLMGVIGDSSAGIDLFTAPEYTINNKGIYDAKVSISGFEDKTIEAGITANSSDLMNLTASKSAAVTENDLYLAVKGLDDTTGGTGFGVTETSLEPYAKAVVTASPLELGTLKSKTSGNFTFIGAAGSGFVDKYMDASFPVEGLSKEDVQKYMDGTSDTGKINASAKYLMKYKIEIDPSRRTP